MKKLRKVIVNIATSADGFIGPRPKGNYGMGGFYNSIDTIRWGRKTALDFQKKGLTGSSFDTKVKNYVFTRGALPSAGPAGVEFVKEPIKEFTARLRRQKGKDIWMMGGAGIMLRFSMRERSTSL